MRLLTPLLLSALIAAGVGGVTAPDQSFVGLQAEHTRSTL